MSRNGSRQQTNRSGQWKTAACLAVFVSAVFSASVLAQTTRQFEEEPLKFGSTPVRLATSDNGGSTSSANDLNVGRVALALGVVLIAIFLLRWIARQFVRPGFQSGKAIKVISRSILSPRQQVILLQVGKRLIVVGDSGGAMNTLCEITDPDEIATMIGNSKAETPMSGAFGKLFRRAKEPFAGADAPDVAEPAEQMPDPEMAEMSRDIGGLMEKVQLMRQQFKRS